MRALLVFLVATSACSFSGSGSPDGGPDGNDGGPDGNDGGPDGMLLPCLSGLYDLCPGAPTPSTALTVSGTMKINTSADANCGKIITQSGGPDICVQYYTNVSIPSGATLIAHGSRAYALSAVANLLINGKLSVATQRNTQLAEPGAGHISNCTFFSDPEADGGGGAGGAGGTYATQGGAGGDGDIDSSTPPDADAKGGIAGTAVPFSLLRGGCQGQTGENNLPSTGAGGRGGGAVYLSARSIQIAGSVVATGAAGNGGGLEASGGGGGGGGSGGVIVIQGFNTVMVTGLVLATGAGGGQGGNSTSNGEAGAEPSTTAAAAGGDQMNNGGNGGNGSTTDAGAPGTSDIDAAGGGGGGGGYIRILSATPTTAGASIAPTPTIVTP